MNNLAYIESEFVLMALYCVILYYTLKYEYKKKIREKCIYIFAVFMCIFNVLKCSFLYERFLTLFDILYFAVYGIIGCLWVIKNDSETKNIKNIHLLPFFAGMICSYLYPNGISLALWYMLLVFTNEIISKQYKAVRTDKLTKLKNRYGMDDEIHEQLEQYKNNRNDIFYVIACDMDDFKHINDTWGHDEGDRALRLVSSVLDGVSKEYQSDAFRIGGDEFVIIADTSEEEKAKSICDELKTRLSNIDFRDDYNIKMSVGIAKYDGKKDIAELLKSADKKLYEAKRKTKDNFIDKL